MKKILAALMLWVLVPGASGAYELNDGIDFLQIKPAPASLSLYEADGTANLGWFETPFENLNLHGPKLRKKMWQFFSFTSATHVAGIAVIDTGYMSNSFAYIFDIASRTMMQFDYMVPFSRVADVSANSVSGTTAFAAKQCSVAIVNKGLGSHEVSFQMRDRQGNTLDGDILVTEQGAPLVNSREVRPDRIVYTHQNSLCRPEGTIVWNGTKVAFSPLTDFGSMDYTAGMHAYKTTWNWASAGGLAKDGTPVAINLAADIGRGTNGVAVFWVGEALCRVPGVVFSYDDPSQQWSVRSEDGRVDLTFDPIGQRAGTTNLIILSSRFIQPIGYFSGTLTDDDGRTVTLDRVTGVAEEHFARW